MRRIARLFVLCAGLLPYAVRAQTSFPFQLSVQEGSQSATITNGSTVNVTSTGIGVQSVLTLTVVYTGSTTATIPANPQILGSSAFTVTPLMGVPLTLSANSTFTVAVQFTPSSAGQVTAQLDLGYVQAGATSSQSPVSGTIAINLVGSAPQISVNYALQANANVLPLPPGGTLQFLPTTVGTTAIANVIILNAGSAAGVVNSVSITGSAFQLIDLPLFPATFAGATALQFEIVYSPKQIGTDQGTLNISIGGVPFTANIAGSGQGSSYSYAVINGGTTTAVAPGQPIPLPDTPVGQSNSVIVQVTNTGNVSGVISAIAVSGAGFSLAGLPFLPLTLAPNAVTTFTLTFTPLQPGPLTGTLLFGSDSFPLMGNGIGVNLMYSYAVSGTPVNVAPAGTVLFSPVMVSQSSSLQFTVSNTGTLAAVISSIGVTGQTSPVFSLANVPSQPLTINPGSSISFSIVFSPTTTSQATATLLVNAQPFTLSGFGTSPPALPAYQISGPTGQVTPFSQPSVGLTLSQSYPLAITGTLALAVSSSSFATDPAVQFSTGGTTVTFTIPANQTQAVFPNGSTQLRFQTGTVAGNITITPSFSTSSGYNLTPQNPTTLVVVVPAQSPTLLTAVVSAEATNGFTLTITGYVTTRSLTALNFTFTLGPGVNSPATNFTVDVSQTSSIWFNGSASTAFGGEFSIQIPFTLQLPQGVSLTTAIQSVSVTASNALGSSSSLTATLQ